MNVQPTFSKPRTRAIDVPNENGSLEQLFQNAERPQKVNPRVRQVVSESFQRNSIVDEPKKIAKKANKPKKRKARSVDSSYDELYESFLRDKKKKNSLKRKQSNATKNVKNSTPVLRKKKKVESLAFGISPIRLDDSGQTLHESGDLTKKLYDSIRRQRLKEIKDAEKDLESSTVREAKALLAKLAMKPLKSIEKAAPPIKSFETITEPLKSFHVELQKTEPLTSFKTLVEPMKSSENMILRTSSETSQKPARTQSRRTRASFERKLDSSADDTMEEPKDVSLNVSQTSLEIPPMESFSPRQSSLEVPLIEVTGPPEEEKENSFAMPVSSFVESPDRKLSIELVEKKRKKKSPPALRLMPSRSGRRQLKEQAEICDSQKSQNSVEVSLSDEDEGAQEVHTEVQASPVIIALGKQIAKKSVAINLVPVITNISRNSPQASNRASAIQRKSMNKKSIRFSESVIAANNSATEAISLRPGKWRRSLISHRKSQGDGKTGRFSSRRTSAIVEDKEEESRADSYAKKVLDTLGDSVLLEQSDEGNLHAALSILDASIKCAASFHDQRKISRQTSVFQRSSIFYGLQTSLIDVDSAPTLSARQIALRRCGQQDPLPFDEIYAESQLPNCCKIGEGVYGEVFMYKCPTTHQPIVLKIIPIEGDLLVNGAPQKRFDEILQEIVISMELSALRNDNGFRTDGFVNVKRVTCVQGAYPEHLIDEWELYRDNRAEGSDNDHPEVFAYDQVYVVFELCNGGRDLEAFVFNNAEEAQSIFLQTALTLAVAEQKFQFEHRDLHWGNILIAPTTEKFVEYRFDGKVVKLPTHGVKVTIIDYSLSRMVYDGAVLYDNLARDEELFQTTGDYQFDIYRLMRQRVENNFERYEPYTNLLWLHYIVDKLINGARYRYSKTKKHRAAVNEMMQERDELLNFTSAHDYVASLDV